MVNIVKWAAGILIPVYFIAGYGLDSRAISVGESRFARLAQTPEGRGQIIDNPNKLRESSSSDSARRAINLEQSLVNAAAATGFPTECGSWGSLCEYLADKHYKKLLSGETI